MTGIESGEYIHSREEVVEERKAKANADFGLLLNKEAIKMPESDEELGSLSYWLTLAENLKKVKETVIKYNEMGGDAQHIYDDLNEKGKVQRSKVESFYNSWNRFLVENARAEEEQLNFVPEKTEDGGGEAETDADVYKEAA
ncbi:MAG TPA: hypothetical protein DEB09_02675 [Candidatus Magasanikbacteria bacterium]|nr:hypothetical protein [Candidatus Magasanikbacteria bacterium]